MTNTQLIELKRLLSEFKSDIKENYNLTDDEYKSVVTSKQFDGYINTVEEEFLDVKSNSFKEYMIDGVDLDNVTLMSGLIKLINPQIPNFTLKYIDLFDGHFVLYFGSIYLRFTLLGGRLGGDEEDFIDTFPQNESEYMDMMRDYLSDIQDTLEVSKDEFDEFDCSCSEFSLDVLNSSHSRDNDFYLDVRMTY